MMYEKQCPKCKETTSKFHLMMPVCDDCINKNPKSPDKYIEHALGILVLNPEWIKYRESLR